MATRKIHPILPYLIAFTFLVLNASIPSTTGARLPHSESRSEVSESNQPTSIFKRQTQGYGFHTNVPNPMQSSNSNSNYNRYESPRSNNLNYNSNPPARDYQYYPSYSGSSASSGGGRSGNYYDRDSRQPYYNDDYRYNNYQRDAAASPNNEVLVRHGQMRHDEYQKRTGSGGPEYYDPFYFIGARNQLSQSQPSQSHHSREPSGLSLSPSVSSLPVVRSTTAITGTTAAAIAPPRNRRNSHQRLNDFNNDINGGKYDIMTKSAYPLPSTSGHHHHHHRLSNHHHSNPNNNQFLTREQLVRQNPDSRVPYPSSNDIEFYRSSSSGQPWSIRIGTQLKVNDDGRSPNPTRFYVRDETNPNISRSRLPIYRR